jgi:hypothetical protein
MAFCIHEKFAVTAYHNLLKDDNTLYQRLALCKIIHNGAIYGPSMSVVTTTHFDATDDWILLSPENAIDSFSNILVLATVEQIPSADDPQNKHVRVIHAPIGMYLQEAGSLEISCELFKTFLSYRPHIQSSTNPRPIGIKCLSSSTSFIEAKDNPDFVWMTVSDGLHSGACGSPYLDCNHRVVAMHIYSANEATPLQEVVRTHLSKKSKERAMTSTEAHCDVKEGLVLCKIASFVQTIRTLLNIDLNRNI